MDLKMIIIAMETYRAKSKNDFFLILQHFNTISPLFILLIK